MLLLFWLLFFLLAVCLVLLIPAVWGRTIYQRHAGSRAVTCPENGRQVAVSFDAFHAAITGLGRRPALRLSDCTRWPERMDCRQDCISQASRTEAYREGEVAPPKTKTIRHLPVLVAAFAAWCLGAIWHSQYLFRAHWTQAVGLGGLPSREVAGSLPPHLLSVAICFLFAYGVAWLLTLSGKRGVVRGIITSVSLWSVIALAGLAAAGVEGLSTELLKIEVTYTVLASVVVGAIEGAFLSRRPGAAVLNTRGQWYAIGHPR